MMKKLWDFWKNKKYGKKSKVLLFLLTHAVIWGLIGIFVWGIISLFTLKETAWLIIFAGYAIIFPGVLGGVIYEMNVERELDEK